MKDLPFGELVTFSKIDRDSVKIIFDFSFSLASKKANKHGLFLFEQFSINASLLFINEISILVFA